MNSVTGFACKLLVGDGRCYQGGFCDLVGRLWGTGPWQGPADHGKREPTLEQVHWKDL